MGFCPFVRGIHRTPVNSPHKGTVMRTFDLSLLLVWTNCWTITRLIGNSRRSFDVGTMRAVPVNLSALNGGEPWTGGMLATQISKLSNGSSTFKYLKLWSLDLTSLTTVEDISYYSARSQDNTTSWRSSSRKSMWCWRDQQRQDGRTVGNGEQGVSS